MIALNFNQARFNMVQQQIRPWNIVDQRVITTLEKIPREKYVPDAYQNFAMAEMNVPLPKNQQMMSPGMEAKMLQALQIKPTDSILEIGTGSGYITACLAMLGSQVTSKEIHSVLAEQTATKLAAANIQNVTIQEGDALKQWHQNPRFDIIAITGSMPVLTESPQNNLNIGGRMFVIIGTAPVMEAILITRTGEHHWNHESLFETQILPLENAADEEEFVF